MTKRRSKRPHSRARTRTRPLRIMVSVLSLHERTGWIHPKLAAEIVRMALASGPRYEMRYVPMHGVYPVSAARNRIVTNNFLPSKADWLCMFDNDIGPPENVIKVILSAPPRADIVILPCWVWCSEKQALRCFGDLRMVKGKPQMFLRACQTGGWQEGGAGGSGAIFIRRRVFKKLKKPYFKFLYDHDEEATVGEDIYFTSKARRAGCRIFTNLDYPCSHYRTIDLAEVNAGMDSLIRRYVKAVQKKYGEHGIALPGFNALLTAEKRAGR